MSSVDHLISHTTNTFRQRRSEPPPPPLGSILFDFMFTVILLNIDILLVLVTDLHLNASTHLTFPISTSNGNEKASTHVAALTLVGIQVIRNEALLLLTYLTHEAKVIVRLFTFNLFILL
ncbi:hypothetical protein L2E82_14704 [Cichorium intybus]|uniref:Uncharacterized protein n=1 Tax=Cichorium intybus TaxID=13427 RepID=A0ACB9F152_CICIN|nr:hypothetical protein L2E82_14704 [Cichorium intybus]